LFQSGTKVHPLLGGDHAVRLCPCRVLEMTLLEFSEISLGMFETLPLGVVGLFAVVICQQALWE